MSWDLLTMSTRDLLQGIAGGTMALDDPWVRTTAATEATMIRNRLGLISFPRTGHDTPFTMLFIRLTDVAARLGTTIDGDEVEPFSRLHAYPADLVDFIEGVIAQCAIDTNVDERIISLPSTGLVVDASMIQDCLIEVPAPGAGDASTVVSIRRPMA